MANARSFIVYMAKYYAKNGYRESGTNHQQFSDIVNRYGLKGYQDNPWCATYQFALELMAFGKAEALRHWNMTAQNYCGMSVFDTEKKFALAGKTGTTPQIGALVIFKQSHMGRVISMNKTKKTFECAEGNSGNACVVKTYAWTDSTIKSFCYIDYGGDGLTREKILGALRAAYEMAHNLGWIYGDSGTTPPCIPDRRISCDRLEALSCFILGYTDQPKGGFVTPNMEQFLTRWGWTVIKDQNRLQAGDFVLFYKDGQSTATWESHAFALTYYTSAANIGKYDLGSNDRIRAAQPYKNVPLDQWGDRHFYAGFRAPLKGELDGTYVIESAVNRAYALDADKNTENIQIWKRYGNKQQKFRLEYIDDGFYRILCGSGKAVDVKSAKAQNRRNIQQYEWNGTKAQLWKPIRNGDGTYTFESALDKNYVIDLRGAKATNGQNVFLYTKTGTDAQKWFLVKK